MVVPVTDNNSTFSLQWNQNSHKLKLRGVSCSDIERREVFHTEGLHVPAGLSCFETKVTQVGDRTLFLSPNLLFPRLLFACHMAIWFHVYVAKGTWDFHIL